VKTALAAVVGQKMENFLTARVKKHTSEINRLIATFTETLNSKGLQFLPPKSLAT
jgi:hypothetical protein